MYFDVEAKWWLKTHHECLDTLRLCQHADVEKQSLEAILVLCNRAHPLARHQLT